MKLHHQRGFAYIAAILLLVALGTLTITVSRLNSTQQLTSAEDAMQSYALQAARAGTEWALYSVLQNGSAGCLNTKTLDLGGLGGGFAVTVTCTGKEFHEGLDAAGADKTINIYTISAIACNSAACPDDTKAKTTGYVERRRVVALCATAARSPC